jgi:hypothetical protein
MVVEGKPVPPKKQKAAPRKGSGFDFLCTFLLPFSCNAETSDPAQTKI